MIALLTLTAWSADLVVEALASELMRTSELRLPEAAAPYFVAYDFRDGEEYEVEASLGAIVREDSGPNRELGIAVHVGSEEMDNTNFNHRDQGDGIRRISLPFGEVPDAVRQAAWLGSDISYKDAVTNFSSKQAARRNQLEQSRPNDFAPGEPHVAAVPPGQAQDQGALAAIARTLSAEFLAWPEIESSRVYVGAEWGRRVLLDTIGTRVQKPLGTVAIRVSASTRSSGGEEIWDHASWTVRTFDQLPSVDVLRHDLGRMAERLGAWRSAAKDEKGYAGPVVFMGDAAIEVVRQLLVPALVGTPPEEVTKDALGGSETKIGGMRLNRRVLPPGFAAFDDPTADPGLPSAYAFDDEGVPAMQIDLVEDGVVRGLYASRVPGQDVPQSNGHGRGTTGSMIRGAPSWLHVEADRPGTEAKLMKVGMKLAAEYGLDHVLVVRRLADPKLGPDAFLARYSASKEGRTDLSAPIEAVRHYADGR
nr:hypothetical protein [Gemmatimonadaceae bacterium]